MNTGSTRRLSNWLTLIACFSIVVFYAFSAYLSLPGDEQQRFHTWLTEHRESLLKQNTSMRMEFEVKVASAEGVTSWRMSQETSPEQQAPEIVRLLELMETSQLFSFQDEHANEASEVHLRIDNKQYTATVSRERIAQNPALQTLLRLSKIYASQNISKKEEVAHANP